MVSFFLGHGVYWSIRHKIIESELQCWVVITHTYSFEVGHVRRIDWCSNETQVVDARLVRAILVVLNEHLSAMVYIISMCNSTTHWDMVSDIVAAGQW